MSANLPFGFLALVCITTTLGAPPSGLVFCIVVDTLHPVVATTPSVLIRFQSVRYFYGGCTKMEEHTYFLFWFYMAEEVVY